MTQKKFQKNSIIAEELDMDKNGIVTDAEFLMKERMILLENQDKKEDQQRYLVWFSAISVTIFIIILMFPWVPISRLDHLTSLGSSWLIGNMGIIGSFIVGNQISTKRMNK
tara:strand:+ start:34 stop:366 length:333 start_codon:yes stop_codon:yes gene_type:complete